MSIHHALADLARDHGHGLFRDATGFRGSLDDYLDRDQTSDETINLLTDAVRLGTLAGMLQMLDSGASVRSAISSAGQRLARDRGSADVRGSRWALAVLGFALGRVPEEVVTDLDPQAATDPPPASPPGWAPPGPPRRTSRAGLIVATAALAVAVLVLVGAIIALTLVATGGDGERSAEDRSSDPSGGADEAPDLGGPVVEGNGYAAHAHDGWNDVTSTFLEKNPGLGTVDKVVVWGDTFGTARANIIIETQSAFGSTDPEDLKADWKKALVRTDPTASMQDIPSVDIDGRTAVGVEISRTNASGALVKQRSHLVIHDDKGYSITVSLRDGDDAVLPKFEELLEAWRWSD